MFGNRYEHMKIKYKLLLLTVVFLIGTFSFQPKVSSYPNSLTLTVISAYQIQLKWNDQASNTLIYYVERRVDGGGYANVHYGGFNVRAFTDTDIESGHTYYYRVGVYEPASNTMIYSNEVYYSPGTSQVISPTSLQVTPVSSAQIDLKWSYSGSVSYTTIIERRTADTENKLGDTDWTTIANVGRGITKYSDKGLIPNTHYYYRITATPDSNNVSLPYPNDSIGIGAYTLLDKPVNVTGVIVGSSNLTGSPIQISLYWYFTIKDYTYFTVERRSATGDYAVLGNSDSNSLSYTDRTVFPNNKYIYRIKAVTGNTVSEYSDEFTIITTTLNPPSSLTVNSLSETKVKLNWIDNSSNEAGFEVWRNSGSVDNWAKVSTVGSNSTSYTDTTITSNTRYGYKVRAYTYNDAYSPFSNDAYIEAASISPPTDLKAEITSASEVTLTWTDSSSSESGYKIEKKTGYAGEWTEIYALPEDSTAYTASGLLENTLYFFRVKAYNSGNSGYAYSSVIEVTTGAPKAPTGLSVQILSNNRIKLSWTDNSGNESGFRIERQKAGGYYSQITETAANATSYIDSDLDPDTQYYYRIKAVNKSGSSDYIYSQNAATKTAVSFLDTADIAWAKDAIEDLASRGVINGKSDFYFVPDDIITRAEFVCAMVRAFNLSRIPVGGFADVSYSHWAYKELMIARIYGIISGDSSDMFYPDKPITREDMAVIITRTLNLVEKPLPAHDTSVLNKFSDTYMIAKGALASMASLTGEKIISGRTSSTINPKDTATRAEAAVMIYKVIDR